MSAVPKPGVLLELQNREDMEIETGEAASGGQRAPGQLWKDNPARVSTLFIGSLGETYMVINRTSSYHKTRLPAFSWITKAPPSFALRDDCQAWETPNSCMSAPKEVGFRQKVFHFTAGRRERLGRKKVFLGATQQAQPELLSNQMCISGAQTTHSQPRNGIRGLGIC